MEVAFEAYGAVKSVKKQTFLSNQIIFNGTKACRCCLIWGITTISDGGRVFVSFVVSW